MQYGSEHNAAHRLYAVTHAILRYDALLTSRHHHYSSPPLLLPSFPFSSLPFKREFEYSPVLYAYVIMLLSSGAGGLRYTMRAPE
jgi:hypothetical protein